MPIRTRQSATARTLNTGAAPPHVAPRRDEPHVYTAQQMENLYARALHRHLAGWPAKEIDFFVNRRRFAQLDRLIGAELRQPGCQILNAASGPFALEFYLGLDGRNIVAFDREPRLWSLYLELKGRGLIGPCRFSVSSAELYMPPQAFDAVVINDLFYSKYVDFYELIPRYIAALQPGAVLYFDIQDERAGPIWRAFGKDGQFRRYDLARVGRVLVEAGLVIEAIEPSLGIKGGADGVVRRALWNTAGIANSFVFVARKPKTV